MKKNIQNPGSAIGEAIGAQMELALNAFLSKLCAESGYHFLYSGEKISGKKKLLLYDSSCTEYNIDSVIANESVQPLILFECKYIRYKNHNGAEVSWLCTAHPAVRRRYRSIRSSIAVLAGNWSSSSLAMIKSFDINVFLIPFERICTFLSGYGIDFGWGEKDRDMAETAWNRYTQLTDREKYSIGEKMISLIEKELAATIMAVLDNSAKREIESVSVELHSNFGEVKRTDFASVREAIDFLNTEELSQVFITTDSLTLFDTPRIEQDDDTSAVL